MTGGALYVRVCDGLLALVSVGEQRVHGAQAGEFCEVSNASKSDPAEWLAMVERPMQGSSYLVRCAAVWSCGRRNVSLGLRAQAAIPILAARPA